MEINLDKEAIERAVTDAIVKSAIGDKIDKTVRELLGKGYDNPIDKAIYKAVEDAALKLISSTHHELIVKAIKEKMTDVAIAEFVNKFWDQVMRR